MCCCCLLLVVVVLLVKVKQTKIIVDLGKSDEAQGGGWGRGGVVKSKKNLTH